MKKRGFEIIEEYKDQDVNLPVRKTKYSAGYDIEALEDVVVPAFKPGIKPVIVKTGIKAYCGEDEYYMVVNRSSNPLKRGLVLSNGIGIIDADYYNNPDNDGEMMFAFYNLSNEPITIEKEYCMGQGIFQKYYITDDDNAEGERIGGFGSTSN